MKAHIRRRCAILEELRGRMIHLLPVVDALTTRCMPFERRTPELVEKVTPLLDHTRVWLENTRDGAPVEQWKALRHELELLQPSAAALDDRSQLLLSNVLYRLGEWIDLLAGLPQPATGHRYGR